VANSPTKTNEVPGVRAKLTHGRFSASKARVVLDLIRGKAVADARDELALCERGAADHIAKLLDSAIANAGNNNDIPPEELFVGACYADEGPTLKRWRPRARGRATQILKRTCHITIIVSRYTPEEMDEIRKRAESRGRISSDARASRARRVAKSRGADEADEATDASDEVAEDQVTEDQVTEDQVAEDQVAGADAAEDGVEAEEAANPAEDGADEDSAEDGATDSATEDTAAEDESTDDESPESDEAKAEVDEDAAEGDAPTGDAGDGNDGAGDNGSEEKS
jgi:large subunit ribosomal protein L22